MALVICSECGKDVSDKAASCPHCGCPVESHANDALADGSKSSVDKRNHRFRVIVAASCIAIVVAAVVVLLLLGVVGGTGNSFPGTMFDSNTGIRINIGMSKSTIGELLGGSHTYKGVEELHFYLSDSIAVKYVDGFAGKITAFDERWYIANGISVGTPEVKLNGILAKAEEGYYSQCYDNGVAVSFSLRSEYQLSALVKDGVVALISLSRPSVR